MKKLFGLMLILAVGAVQAEVKSHQDMQVISLFDLEEEMDITSGAIIECLEGVKLPFHLIIQGEFLELEQEAPLYLKVLKTCYVRYEADDHFLFSTDLNSWKEFSEFFTGNMQISAKAEQGEPVASLKLELNQR